MFYHCIFSSYKLNAVNVFLQKSKCGFSLLRISQPVVIHSVQYWYFYLLSISILFLYICSEPLLDLLWYIITHTEHLKKFIAKLCTFYLDVEQPIGSIVSRNLRTYVLLYISYFRFLAWVGEGIQVQRNWRMTLNTFEFNSIFCSPFPGAPVAAASRTHGFWCLSFRFYCTDTTSLLVHWLTVVRHFCLLLLA